METDLGDKEDPRSPPQPHGYYEDEIPPLEHENTQQWGPPPQPQMMFMPPQQAPAPPKRDIFSEIDKTTYIVAFVVFILGFFMGKTMQPVILRNV
tara:strand:- start:408 stop:692 length:285 start_codon:yes stop_codon:yes gene_type:complete